MPEFCSPFSGLAHGRRLTNEELVRAIDVARYSDRAACARFGAEFSWEAATEQFLRGLEPLGEAVCPDLNGLKIA